MFKRNEVFDPTNAFFHVNNLSFPRLSGTSGEEMAREYILETLKGYGLDPQVQNFSFSTLPAMVFLKLLTFSVGIFAFVASIFINTHIVLSGFLIIAAFVLLSIGSRWRRCLETLYDIGKQKSSSNIIAEIPGSPESSTTIVFLAHYDSKSQSLPLLVRVGLSIFIAVGVIVLFLLTLVTFVTKWLFLPNEAILSIGILLFVSSFILVVNSTSNASPGALDNASGTAVLLELSRVVKRVKARVVFVFTGAEELGLVGAARFIQEKEDTFLKDRTYFINLDGAGAEGNIVLTTKYGLPPLNTAKTLKDKLFHIAKGLNINLKEGYLPIGAGLDHMPVASRGFEALTISSGRNYRVLIRVHSSRDTPDLISIDKMRKIGRLLEEFITHC